MLAFEPVAVGGEAFQFLDIGGHEPVELVVEHARERVLLGGRDLDAAVVVLDELLDILDEHRLARAVGAFGVPPGAHEVNRPRFDAGSFRVWKEDSHHAEADPGGDEAASDPARARPPR
ncbi:hypothetical protein [Agrococcus lahaulensis]|uniref:hypothetical protein n=1 Tax=Agrococcus lahaulensis TaxID=341722 RepID=UPI00146D3C7F|nr:hypothetical protein [Agrococcus lahaulensis]